jgi:hypothetical protein
VLWPESGLADYLRPGYPQRYYDHMTVLGDPEFARRRIGRLIGPGSVLLTGAVDLEIGPVRRPRASPLTTRSPRSMPEGTIVGGYAKAHLVPYGEYCRCARCSSRSACRAGGRDARLLPRPGPAHARSRQRTAAAGVQSCYEIVFSGQWPIAPPARLHLQSLERRLVRRFRSAATPRAGADAGIEEGLPVLRATTTGISAVIDPAGVVRHHLPMHRAGRIDGVVPRALPPTLFAHMGHGLTLVWTIYSLRSPPLPCGRGAFRTPRRTHRLIQGSNFMRQTYLFTSESVSEGHPDKVSDQISDAIVDLFLSKDPEARVACETLTTTQLVVLAGEIRCKGVYEDGGGRRARSTRSRRTVRNTVREIGYEQSGFHWQTLTFENHCTASRRTSPRASMPSGNKDEGAGDQGIMFGFACDETPDLMPATLDYSHKILERMAADRHSGAAPFLEPDAKSQVTLKFDNGKPVGGDRDRRLDPARQGLRRGRQGSRAARLREARCRRRASGRAALERHRVPHQPDRLVRDRLVPTAMPA